ncbi:chromobox protein homolog 3 [Caerostris darwini]|uniref:Chromobox protein homolog 3 n=1 Tax=Caerostris darwini TaxID=1538125 RepID=A0AAV4UQ38_9ARAC|nr:chromobox protein homolog 3 [Caerostris darwini]
MDAMNHTEDEYRNPKNQYPPELLRRFEIYFKNRSEKDQLSVREVKAEHIRKLITVRCTEVKPMLVVSTYTRDQCGAETFKTVLYFTKMSRKGKIILEPDPTGEPDQYMVEKIVDKRIANGKIEYFLKWHGYADSENTWEPVENLECPEMIEDFEKKLRKANESAEKQSEIDLSEITPPLDFKDEKLDWMKLNLQPERIIGAKGVDGELMLLIKWKDYDVADLVPSKTANIKWPQDVIRFYEKQISWQDVIDPLPPSNGDAEKNEETSA